MPENEEKPKRVERFVYSEEDVKHIFGLGKTGKVFTKEERTSVLLKKIQEIKRKITKQV